MYVKPSNISKLCIIFLTLLPGVTFAMGIRQTRTLLARSPDGAHALYELRGHGPEGGGSLGYRLEGRRRDDTADYAVSSTFSPGDGSRPQTIAIDVCVERVDALGAALVKRGFRGVTTHAEGCRTKARDGLVTVD